MSFPFAALNRLVEVCAGTSLHGSGTDNLSVLTVLDQLVADSMTGLTTGFEDFDLASQEFWGARTSHRVLAIAGLIDNRVIEILNKVPGLGDVPVLGRLFRSRSTKKSNDELLVVVTPHFVKPLSPEEKIAMPAMPLTFLPAVVEPKDKKGKAPAKEPEFVGPRGQQIPK